MDAALFWNAATAVSTAGTAVIALAIAVSDRRKIRAAELARARLAAIGYEHKLREIAEEIGHQQLRVDQALKEKLVYGLHPNTKAILDIDKHWNDRMMMMDTMRGALRRCEASIDPAEVEKIAALPNHCAANVMRARIMLLKVDEAVVIAQNTRRPDPQIQDLIKINGTLVEINKLVTSTAEVCKREVRLLTAKR